MIDGDDRDAVWAAAPLGPFRVFDPAEDGEPTLRTEARLAFDARHLYVFVRAFDPRPDSVVSRLSRRDVRTPSDQIKVMIDSYHDPGSFEATRDYRNLFAARPDNTIAVKLSYWVGR